MKTTLAKTATLALTGVVALTLAACAAGSRHTGSGMMGGAGAGYQYSDPRCAVPVSLPGRTVTLTLADMGMNQMMDGTAPLGAGMTLRAAPVTVVAGQISLVVDNLGWRTHELVILPLPAGAAAGARVAGPDGKVAETGALGEASANCAGGTGDGISGGAVGWVTVTLPAGRYELVCNLPNHYADGMHQEFDVTA